MRLPAAGLINWLYLRFGVLDKTYLDEYYLNPVDAPITYHLKLLNYAEDLMREGDLEKAVEVIKLINYPLRAQTMEKWLEEAEHRLYVEKSIELLKIHMDCLIMQGNERMNKLNP